MDGWRIDPRAARAILRQASSEAHDGMHRAMQTVASSVERAHAAAGPETRAALLALGSDLFEAEIAATRARLNANISAADHAIAAYEHGDEHMAATWAEKPR